MVSIRRLKIAVPRTLGIALMLAPAPARADIAVTPFGRSLDTAELAVGIAIIVIVSGLSWRALRAIREREK